MASLGLGWVGEPAFAHLLEPIFHIAGVTSATVRHTCAFIIAFTVITALHLVIGEQAPKIFAIRRPEIRHPVVCRSAEVLLPLLVSVSAGAQLGNRDGPAIRGH